MVGSYKVFPYSAASSAREKHGERRQMGPMKHKEQLEVPDGDGIKRSEHEMVSALFVFLNAFTC